MARDKGGTFEFVTVGDVHLKKKRLLDLFGHGATDLMLGCVRAVFQYAVDNGVPHVVFLGDIGDEPSLGDYCELKLLELLHEFDDQVEIHIMLGNHDVEQKHVHSLCKVEWMASIGAFKTVHVYTEHVTKELDGVPVEFMSWPAHEPQLPNSLCFAHLERPGALRDNGTPIDDDHGIPEPETDNIWVMGHLHTYQKVGSSTYYPGTLYQTSFGEQPDKYRCHYRVRMAKGKPELKFRSMDSESPFKLINLDVTDVSDLKGLDPNPLIKYRILYGPEVNLPDSFLRQHPNVVDARPYATKVERDELIIETDSINYTVFDSLDQYLLNRGHDTKFVTRARREVRRLLKSKGQA